MGGDFLSWEAESQIKFDCQLATLKLPLPYRWLTYRNGPEAAYRAPKNTAPHNVCGLPIAAMKNLAIIAALWHRS